MSTVKIVIINGPNLNLLGARENEHYGCSTLSDIERKTRQRFEKYPLSLEFFQSNIEGEIVEKIHRIMGDQEVIGLIINPGGYSHSSVAIHDALKLIRFYKIEVHLSSLIKREEFRQIKITAKACDSLLEGLGDDCYSVAILSILLKRGDLCIRQQTSERV